MYSGVTCVLKSEPPSLSNKYFTSVQRLGQSIAVAVRLERGIDEGLVGSLLTSQDCREVICKFKQVAERTRQIWGAQVDAQCRRAESSGLVDRCRCRRI